MDCQFMPLVSPKRYLSTSGKYRHGDLFVQSGSQNHGMPTMGSRLKSLRASKRLTQKQLAAKTGLAQATISDLERGDSKTMEAETLKALCRELVTTPAYLLDGVNTGEEHEAMMQEAELIAIFRELPAQAKTALVGSARLLREAMPTQSAAQPIIRNKGNRNEGHKPNTRAPTDGVHDD